MSAQKSNSKQNYAKTNSPTSSIVTKCIHMVDILAMAEHPLSFSELVRHSGLAKSSTHRILTVLVQERLATYDMDKKSYTLGGRSLSWARSFINRTDLPVIADKYVEDLCQRTGMNGTLSLREQDAVLYLRTYNPIMVKFAPPAGDRAPLHCTAAGKVLLAYSSPETCEYLLQRIQFVPYTKFSIKDLTTLRVELDKIRRQGYGLALQEELFQVMGIAAPIFDNRGDIIATISLWTLSERTNQQALERLSQPLFDAATHIMNEYHSLAET